MSASRRSSLFLVLLAALVLCGPACKAPAERGPLTTEGDEAFRNGEYERAWKIYAERYEQRKNPLLKEKMNLARARAHGSATTDPAEADRQIRSSNQMIERGDRMLADDRPVEALKAYRTAQEYVPGVPEAREGEVRAEQAISAEAIARAREFLRQGQAGRALEALDGARAEIGEPFDPQTDALTATDTEIRGSVAATLLDRAKAELAAERPSAALLFAAAWLQVTGAPVEGPHPEPVNQVLLRFKRANLHRIHVGEIVDGTDGLVDGASFEHRFLAAWQEWEQTEDAEGIRLTPDVEEADLALDITIESLAVETSEPVMKAKEREFVIATDAIQNPKLAKLRKARDRLDEDLRVAEDLARDARMEYHAVRRLEGDAEINARYSRLYGHYSRAAFYRHFANARSRDAKAKRRVDQLTDARDEILAKMKDASPVIYRETRARATVQETIQSKSAHATVAFRLIKIREDAVFPAAKGSVKAKDTVKDIGWPALEAEGIAAEPLTLPPDAALAETVLDDVAGRLAKAVLAKARAVHRQTYDRARENEQAGEAEAALDLYAAFVLTAGESFPLEARVAVDKIEAQWGLRPTGDGGLDLTNLRLDAK